MVLLLIWVVRTVWTVYKATRAAIPCEECGRTFLQTSEGPGAIFCSRSGQQRRGPSRSLRILAIISWNWAIISWNWAIIVLTLWVILEEILRDFTGGFRAPKPRDQSVELLGISVGVTMLVFFSVRAYLWYSTVRSKVSLQECEIAISMDQDDPRICPACRLTRLGADKARKVRAKVINRLLLEAVVGFLIPPAVVVGFLKWRF